MFRSAPKWLLALGLASVLAVAGCSSSSNPSSGGNNSGGGPLFDSGNIQPGSSFTFVFTSVMVVPYYCAIHGGPGGVGMSGIITVTAGGTPTHHTFSITDLTLPTMAVNVGDTMTWTNNSSMVHTVHSDH